MANALERHRIPRAKVPDPPKGKDAPPSPTEVAQLLEGVRQPTANELLRVFDAATSITGATMGEVMWTLAMLQARVLASADMGDGQVWAAARFAELVQLALPAMMLAVEQAKHAQPGKQKHDA